jgi:prepilin-type N-terminal cleavage/methylation domain-containing protein
MANDGSNPHRHQGGFTLIELLSVVAIIAVMAAVSLPAIGRYIRNFKIRGAVQNVAGEMQNARAKAITKNVNLGVVFAVLDQSAYQWVIEDDQTLDDAQRWYTIAAENWANLATDRAQSGPVSRLGDGLQFRPPGECPNVAGTANTWGVRFTRLGSLCAFGASGCGPEPPGAAVAQNLVLVDASGQATVCVGEMTTGLRRALRVSSGGRVLAVQ